MSARRWIDVRNTAPERIQAALLGILAILFQAWLPLVHHPATYFAPDGQEAAFARLFGQNITICGAETHGPSKPGDHAPAPGQTSCPICQALHAIGHFTPPPIVGVALPVGYFLPYESTLVVSSILVRLVLAAQPRAPPNGV